MHVYNLHVLVHTWHSMQKVELLLNGDTIVPTGESHAWIPSSWVGIK